MALVPRQRKTRGFSGDHLAKPSKSIQKNVRRQYETSVFHLNVESLNQAKSHVLENLAKKPNVSVILLQETHSRSNADVKIIRYTPAASDQYNKHGICTLIKNNMPFKLLKTSLFKNSIYWIAIAVEKPSTSSTYINPYQQNMEHLHPSLIQEFT